MSLNLQELRASTEVELEAAKQRQRKAFAEVQLIHAEASQEGRSNLTEDETTRVKAAFDKVDLAKADQTGIESKLANVKRLEAEDADFEQRANATHSTGAPSARRTASVAIGREERTYHKGNDPAGKQFLKDVARQHMYNDVGAAARLNAHMNEESVDRAASGDNRYFERAVGTTAFAGLIVPQYLVDMVAPAIANLRPFADSATNKHSLPPDGMSVNISRITTATGAALQASENSAVQETNMDDTLLTVNVQTAAGQQTISRQAIDRGNGIEETALQDLFSRYATVLDNTLLNQASTGLAAAATAVTFTTPVTAAGLYPKLLGASAGVEAAMLGFGSPTHAVMHSRRWYWMAKELGSTWPLINSQGIPTQAIGTLNPASSYGSGVRGVLPNGLAVVVDNNVVTTAGGGTEDEVYVVPSNECHLWEDPSAPAMIRAEQPAAGTLGVLLVVYGYFAYTFQRYANGMQKVSGAGLIAPTF